MLIDDLFLSGSVVVIDLETTGTDVKTARAVEVAALCLSTPEPSEGRLFAERANPGLRYLRSPEFEAASAIHGITADDLADCPSSDDVLDAVAEGVRSTAPAAVIGYNSEKFDLRVAPALRIALSIDVFRLVQKLAEECPRATDPEAFCLSYGAVVAHPEGLAGLRHSLGSLFAALHDAPLDGAHAAAVDVTATWHVLAELLAGWSTYLLGRITPTWQGLAAYLERPPAGWSDWNRSFTRKGDLWLAGFGKHKGLPIGALPKSYLRWMLGEDFDRSTLDLVRAHL